MKEDERVHAYDGVLPALTKKVRSFYPRLRQKSFTYHTLRNPFSTKYASISGCTKAVTPLSDSAHPA